MYMMLFSTTIFLNLVLLLQLYKYNCQLKMFTPNNEFSAEPLLNYGFDITNVTDIKYSVKACANAHLIIQKTPLLDFNTSGNYVFIVGSFSGAYVDIRDSVLGNYVTTLQKSFLDCYAYKSFWISWENGNLKLGKGTVLFTDEIIAGSVGPLIDYKYIFLLTGWGSHGCWTVDIGTRVVGYRTKIVTNNKMIQGSGIQIYTVKSKLECLTKCVSDVSLPCACKLFSYNKTTKQCLVSRSDITVTLIDDSGWKTWQLL